MMSDDDYYIAGLIILALIIRSPLPREALEALVYFLDQYFKKSKEKIIEFAKDVLH